MSKLLLKLFFTFCLLLIFSFTKVSSTYAACPISLSQTNIAADFNDTIIITTNTDCFPPQMTHIAIAWPASFRNLGDTFITQEGYQRRPPSFISTPNQRTDPRNIVATLNLTLGKQTVMGGAGGAFIDETISGNDYPNQRWNIIVCRANSIEQCIQNPNNILGNTQITVGKAIPTPTPTSAPLPSDLPLIDKGAQSQCAFDNSNSAIINKITNIQPNTSYGWWWRNEQGDVKLRQSFNTDTISFTIPQEEISQIQGGESRQFCIDKDILPSQNQYDPAFSDPGYQPRRETGNNCLPIKFTAGPPSAEEKSCENTSKTADSGPKTSSGGISCDISQNGAIVPSDEISPGNVGVWTAIGCIPTQPTQLIESLLKLATGIGGGVALLLFIAGTFQMITSAGNPDGVKKGSEQMTAAIIGLLFIIFSVMLLKIIGVDILMIPGFEK